jgi:hypothetical protein
MASSTDYLRFDAYSIKNLIKQKLSEDVNFTDYAYEGSNLSVLVDIVSTQFAALMFNLNQAASESMMSDSNIYENISRLVKFIGYNPAGYQTSTVNVIATAPASNSLSFVIVPPFSTIKLTSKDSKGDAICFSTIDYYYVSTGSSTTIPLYNGKWTKYNNVFTAQGIPFEKFVLSDLTSASTSTSTTSTYVAYPHIKVFIKRKLSSSRYRLIQYTATTEGLFSSTASNSTSVISASENKFALRLNEYKQYEIQFGDNVHGAALKSGDIVTVVYLKSNGPDGEITAGTITNEIFSVDITGIDSTSTENGTKTLTLTDIMKLSGNADNTIWSKTVSDGIRKYSGEAAATLDSDYFYYSCTNKENSSTTSAEETVSQIRENAPNWFKSIGRTITTADYTSYVKSKFYNDLTDVVVMNNFKYIATFFKWLWFLGLNKCGDPRKWINSSLSSKGTYGYTYADAADSNNVYIWIKQNVQTSSIAQTIINSLQDVKPLTSEPVVLSAVDETFDLCAGYLPDDASTSLRTYYNKNGSDSDKLFVYTNNGQNRLEVELDSNTSVAVTVIKNQIISAFENFFSNGRMDIGSDVNLSDLTAAILAISGIKRVRTIFRKLDTASGEYSKTDVIIQNGVSLCHYNTSIVNGYDIEYSNGNIKLEEFQYPGFSDFAGLFDLIDVVSVGSSNVVDLEY